jgi:hypothetical protein
MVADVVQYYALMEGAEEVTPPHLDTAQALLVVAPCCTDGSIELVMLLSVPQT